MNAMIEPAVVQIASIELDNPPSLATPIDGPREELIPQPEVDRAIDEVDELGQLSGTLADLVLEPILLTLLSDSASSHVSTSRPTTPAHPTSNRPASTSNTYEPLTLAHKAERILGLFPGTLAYGRACLENAQDEVRRTAEWRVGDLGGIKDRMKWARKAMNQYGKVPSAVLAAEGTEEEERRERRRRAVDGVLYWQKEVARLDLEERHSARR
ncbi:MAG: hypothetical protein TREMPRED_003065 [Tremellales sp. Tagirdzhanova-0007]|nr:MAG: hypothetical protein TREMPRED_003065 [Tremellales sp. Tagirdzhanova-0007]